MTQFYQRNPAHHGLLARQGAPAPSFGNNSHNNPGRQAPGPDSLSSQAPTGMFTAWLLPS